MKSKIKHFASRMEIKMRIAVLSGKGGAGKTLLSVNLAVVAKKSTYIDCDVEEPNGHLFFKPPITKEKEISIKIPEVDKEICNGCRKCVEFCNYNALAYAKDKVIVFDEICHSCGGCMILCPEKAISERDKVIGKIKVGSFEEVMVLTGILNTGEVSGIPIINELLLENRPDKNRTIFIDCPPGSSCSVMESIKDADYCILVAEPTLFGVHNLNMVYELVKLFNKPFGAVLNKCLDVENPAEEFCAENDIKILGRIPFDKELGILNSNAKIAVRESKEYAKQFSSLLDIIFMEARNEAATNT
jgi:MinD superfamily P-loop ATPase